MAAACAHWSVTPGPPFDQGAGGLVVPVEGRGLDAVVKVQFPHHEATFEADALRAWDGRGAIRLLDDAPALDALLLERCRPGTPVSQGGDDALAVMAELVTELAIAVDGPFTTLADEAAMWIEHMPVDWERHGRPYAQSLLDESVAYLSELRDPQAPPVLLHQDLHGDNVLAAQRRPWLVVDPKPLVGELAFALAPIVRSAELGHSRAAVVHRLDFLSDALHVDRERARKWTIGQTMAWVFDEFDRPIDGHLDVVVWLLDAV